jgi:hypothetical protein
VRQDVTLNCKTTLLTEKNYYSFIYSRNINLATQHGIDNMTEHKSEYIESVVEKFGKSADRVRAANTTFTTFRMHAESCGVECESGRDRELPNVI